MLIGLEQTDVRALAMKPEIENYGFADDFKTIAESQTKFEAEPPTSKCGKKKTKWISMPQIAS